MTDRSQALHEFLGSVQDAVGAQVGAGNMAAARAMRRVGASLRRSNISLASFEPRTRPACAYLEAAIAGALDGPDCVARVAGAITTLAPALSWRLKASDDLSFADRHANADILGPSTEALARLPDVRVGLSLMAPATVYPDHSHPPEEVYLALSPGSWRQENGAWHEPGIGGIVYNPAGVTHAMKSGSAPFLAVWCLPLD